MTAVSVTASNPDFKENPEQPVILSTSEDASDEKLRNVEDAGKWRPRSG